jgi:phenylalanyl-tRNA synthetase alpha subunit
MSEQYRVSVVFEGRDELSATVKQVAANMGETASLTSRVAEVTEKLKARTSDATEAYTKMRSELREAAFAANAVERAFKIQHSTIGDVIGVLNGLSNMIGRVQQMFTQYQVTQIRLEEIKQRVALAEERYAAAVVKSGAGSAEAAKAAKELANAKRDLEIATMQANAQLIGFALQMPGLAKNVFDMAAKLANLGVGFHSLNNAVQAASTAIVGFGASVKAALPTLLSLAGVFTAIAGGFILVQDAAARAAPGLEDFVRGARDWRDAMRPDFVKQTTQAVSEQAKTVAESTEALGWFAGEFDDVNKNMEETARKGGNLQNVLKNLASTFGLPGDRIAALINQMFGLNITYDQHADLVAKLTKELGLNEEQARQLINTLTAQAERQKTVEEATRNAEKAAREQEATYRKLVKTLNENINTLLNFGQVQGPLTNTLNNIRGALADLGNSISENVKGKIEEALRYFEDVNRKFQELETNSRLVGAANQLAGIGLSYYNAQTAVSKALIVDEVQALDARISKLKEEIATRQEALREAERQGREDGGCLRADAEGAGRVETRTTTKNTGEGSPYRQHGTDAGAGREQGTVIRHTERPRLHNQPAQPDADRSPARDDGCDGDRREFHERDTFADRRPDGWDCYRGRDEDRATTSRRHIRRDREACHEPERLSREVQRRSLGE